MFNSMIGSITSSFIFDLFIVFAVVIAGSIICYFAGEAITSAIKDRKQKSKNSSKEELVFDKEETKTDEKVDEKGLVTFTLDAEETEKLNAPVEAEESEEFVDVDEDKAEEEKVSAEDEISQEERENQERRAYLEARRQELLRRLQEDDEESDDEDDY